MRLWLTRASDIPVRDQLETQLTLAILSGEIKPGERLPSTRELARRYKIHANTVSAAFRALEAKGWVELRKGSGIYVRGKNAMVLPAELMADHLVTQLVRSAKANAISLLEVRSRLDAWIGKKVRRILVVDADEQLRRILAAELAAEFDIPITHKASDDNARGRTDTLIVALSADAQDRPHFIRLQLASAGQSLAGWLPAPKDKLVAIVSAHARFLEIANTFLRAAGFPPDAIFLRNTGRARWKEGLDEADAVVCDSLSAKSLPRVKRVIPFRLISASSLAEIKSALQL